MTHRLVLLVALVPAAHAQFAFSVINGTTETPVPPVYDLDSVWTGDSISTQFRLRNTSNNAANLTALHVSGVGFSISALPSLPKKLNPQDTVNFIVNFQASTAGSYSASLGADGISVYLRVAVVLGLTYPNLGPAPVDFGSVQVGQTALRHFLVVNGTAQALAVPPINVSNGDFSVSGLVPSSATLQPGEQAALDLQFQPATAGIRAGTLTIGTRSYSLTGTGIAMPPPPPKLTIFLSEPQSAQQGSVTVNFGAPATAGGSGTLTLQFQPAVPGATDPAIAFAAGGQSVPFIFTAGDIQATFGSQRSAGFQTGTTAGIIRFTAQIGSLLEQQSITLAPAAVSFTATSASRSPANVSVQVTGFDNTRTAGPLTFTFYDNLGNVIAPGPIPADATSAFAQYFAGSVGGTFRLNAVFPVTGDSSGITYVQAVFSNSAGSATTLRTSF